MNARILVAGSRGWTNTLITSEALKAGLALLQSPARGAVLVHGTASAGDAVLVSEALKLHMDTEAHPGENADRINASADLCLAFPAHGYTLAPGSDPSNSSRGTWDCAEKARNASIPTLIVWGRDLYPFGDPGLELLTREANRKGLKLGPAGQMPILEAWLPF